MVYCIYHNSFYSDDCILLTINSACNTLNYASTMFVCIHLWLSIVYFLYIIYSLLVTVVCFCSGFDYSRADVMFLLVAVVVLINILNSRRKTCGCFQNNLLRLGTGQVCKKGIMVCFGVCCCWWWEGQNSGTEKWCSVSQPSNEGVKPGRKGGRKERKRKKKGKTGKLEETIWTWEVVKLYFCGSHNEDRKHTNIWTYSPRSSADFSKVLGW